MTSRVRALLLRVAGLGGVFLVAVLVAVWLHWRRPAPVPPGADPAGSVLVHLPPGITFAAAVDTLCARGLLREPRLFRLAARWRGIDRRLHAGNYRLPYGLSPGRLLERLASGRTELVSITLPEGETAPRLAAIIGSALAVPATRVLAVADSLVRPLLVADGGLDSARVAAYDSLLRRQTARFGHPFALCEGYLFPETYRVDPGAPLTELIGAILAEGRRRRESLARAHPLPEGWTWHQVLTLASIVEAETPQAGEKPRVAAVYRRRLARGWKLEADPTVAFVLGKRGERILYRDLAVDSPFNTYRHTGLPPGPIGNPGQAAVLAVLEPDPQCRALYFVADGQGGHVFSRTLAEHRRAVRQYRRRRDGQR